MITGTVHVPYGHFSFNQFYNWELIKIAQFSTDLIFNSNWILCKLKMKSNFQFWSNFNLTYKNWNKPFPQGGLWTRFHDIKCIIVRGFYHARVKGLASEIYERSKCFRSPLGLPAFLEVGISKWTDYKLEENGSDLEQT